MRTRRTKVWSLSIPATALLSLLATTASAQQGGSPSVAQALTYKPIQEGIEYDQPSRDEVKSCSIKPERDGKNIAWAVRDASGRLLRRFSDSNGDNVVDTWSYYLGGLEVYRDIDSNYDSKADQCRWLHTGGSRWGVDQNQDGEIDFWKQISPQEVAEEAVQALLQKDKKRYARLLISSNEAKSLGMGKELAQQVEHQRTNAVSEFEKLATTQKTIDAKSRFVDFGASRPGVAPAGVDGSTKDVLVYENASALVDNDGKPEQLLLGSIFQVGDGWRLASAPRLGDSGPALASVFSVPGYSGGAVGEEPSDEMQKWMSELEKLDRESGSATGQALARSTQRRAQLLQKLAEASDGEESIQWYTQLADMLSAAAQSHGFKEALAELEKLENASEVKKLGKPLVAHVHYQRVWGEYGLALQNPKADFAKVQEKWLEDLESFVNAFPGTPDTAEAMLQLGSGLEAAGESDDAKAWYSKLQQEFPRTAAGRKAAGALWRIDSIGKPFPLAGNALRGGSIDLTKPPYRGRTVVVHYWTTWSPIKDDLRMLAAMQKQYGAKLAIVGVNLDNSAAEAKEFLTTNRIGWKHLYDEQGLEGKLASDAGVMNLPLMILVDPQGKVANRNLYGPELEDELERVIR